MLGNRSFAGLLNPGGAILLARARAKCTRGVERLEPGRVRGRLFGKFKWWLNVEPVDAVECFEEGDQVLFFGVGEVEGG